MDNLQFLNEANVGNIATTMNLEARKLISERWEKLGLTKGLTGHLKDNLSLLYENQAKVLREATDAQNSGSFETVVFPLVRRVFSRLLANDIVSVQAMNLPIGKLFYILPVTSDRKDGLEEIDGKDYETFSHYGLMGKEGKDTFGRDTKRYYLPDDVIIQDASGDTPELTQYQKKSLYDMFYNDGLFDHSKGKMTIVTGKLKAANIGFNGEVIDDKSGDTKKLAFDGTVRNVIVKVSGFSQVNPGRLTGPDGNEMDSESFLSSLHITTAKEITTTSGGTAAFNAREPVMFRCVTQQYGKGLVQRESICNANGEILLELDLTKPVIDLDKKTIDGYIGVDEKQIKTDEIDKLFNVAWARYESLELETEIGEVSFKLADVTVTVQERKLRATWSPELAQDVAAFHNIDAEAELTAILSEQIAAEIDREILRDLRRGAPWQLKWDYNGWRRMSGYSTNYTQKDWNQTLLTKINQISAQIHKSTLRGGASFIVVSSELSAVLNDLEYFHVTDANAEAVNYSLGIEKVGSLQGRYEVYVDPYAPACSMIIGHKGASLLDTGYIYAPYVPMQLTPTIHNYNNFAPVKGILTRYAKKMVNNRYYGAIVANGLQTWNINELR